MSASLRLISMGGDPTIQSHIREVEMNKEQLYGEIESIGVVGPAWEKTKEVLKKIVDSIPITESVQKKGKK